MWKKSLLLLAGCGLALLLAAASPGGLHAGESDQPAAVRLKGTLRLQFDPREIYPPYIQAAWLDLAGKSGKSFVLHIPPDRDFRAAAYHLDGKRVLVKGTLTDEGEVIVTGLRADPADSVAGNLELHGRLDANAPVGYPLRAPAVTVNGETYVLDFGTHDDLRQLAGKLSGKRVVVTGSYGGMRSFPVMCVPEPARYPVILVTGLQVEELPGAGEVEGK
jgi:hypothetical protein